MFRAQNQNNVHGYDINSGNYDDSDFCVGTRMDYGIW
jgi:hypothetical protein